MVKYDAYSRVLDALVAEGSRGNKPKPAPRPRRRTAVVDRNVAPRSRAPHAHV